MNILALICFVCAVVPAALLILNLALYRRAPQGRGGPVSILIPARNEEASIHACVMAALAAGDRETEVIVLDDHSTDRTADIVKAIPDPRVRLLNSLPLPPDWCGKQFACHQLASNATREHLIFIDADVRLEPGAAARLIAALRNSRAHLISGVPRQITRTFSEKLLIPLIHFILLGYLPIPFMRRSRSPAFAAGCGQLFVTTAQEYRRSGGHAAIAGTGHDGLELPRAYRRRQLKTDLFDATDLATCRMYRSDAAVWSGLAKNAREGIARPSLILPFTILFLFGQILPGALLLVAWLNGATTQTLLLLGVGTIAGHAARAACTRRFEQSWLGTSLHILGIFAFLTIQWWAAYQERRGRPLLWKGRPQPRLAATMALLLSVAAISAAESLRGEDQFGQTRSLEFPATNLTILTIADRSGAGQVDDWITALKVELTNSVAYEGIADLSKVPAPLRGFVRSRFAKAYQRPMLLDWKGEFTPRFKPERDVANVYLLDTSGNELLHIRGKLAPDALKAFLIAVRQNQLK